MALLEVFQRPKMPVQKRILVELATRVKILLPVGSTGHWITLIVRVPLRGVGIDPILQARTIRARAIVTIRQELDPVTRTALRASVLR
jgi:hypothetical protein